MDHVAGESLPVMVMLAQLGEKHGALERESFFFFFLSGTY